MTLMWCPCNENWNLFGNLPRRYSVCNVEDCTLRRDRSERHGSSTFLQANGAIIIIQTHCNIFVYNDAVIVTQIVLLTMEQWPNGESRDDVIKWKRFPRYWPFVRGIPRSLVNSPQKGLWRGALMYPLICVWINGWVNNREAGDLRRYGAHYDVTVMKQYWEQKICIQGNAL